MEKIHILSLFWCFISALQKKYVFSKYQPRKKKIGSPANSPSTFLNYLP